jgi:hypothetical protein
MPIRLLINRPSPVHAVENNLSHTRESFPAPNTAHLGYTLTKKVDATLKGALAQAVWISLRGAVSIVAVNDNGSR